MVVLEIVRRYGGDFDAKLQSVHCLEICNPDELFMSYYFLRSWLEKENNVCFISLYLSVLNTFYHSRI